MVWRRGWAGAEFAARAFFLKFFVVLFFHNQIQRCSHQNHLAYSGLAAGARLCWGVGRKIGVLLIRNPIIKRSQVFFFPCFFSVLVLSPTYGKHSATHRGPYRVILGAPSEPVGRKNRKYQKRNWAVLPLASRQPSLSLPPTGSG